MFILNTIKLAVGRGRVIPHGGRRTAAMIVAPSVRNSSNARSGDENDVHLHDKQETTNNTKETDKVLVVYAYGRF